MFQGAPTHKLAGGDVSKVLHLCPLMVHSIKPLDFVSIYVYIIQMDSVMIREEKEKRGSYFKR